MTGFLNDLGLDNVEADPNYMADGEYPGFVYDAKVITKKKDGTTQLVLTYKAAPEAPKHSGQTQDEFYKIGAAPGNPASGPSEANKSWLKRRMLSLGVPESKINEIDVTDLVGTPVFFTIKHANGYQNIGDVRTRIEGSAGMTQPIPSTMQTGTTVSVPAQSNVSNLM